MGELQATWLGKEPWVWSFKHPTRVVRFEGMGDMAGFEVVHLRVGDRLLVGDDPIPLALLCGYGPPGGEMIIYPAQHPGHTLSFSLVGPRKFDGHLRPIGWQMR